MHHLGWALVTTGVLGVVLWVVSRVVYHLGVLPLVQVLSRLTGGSRWPHYVFLLPGTALHEFSHWIVCKLLLVRVIEFVPFSPRRDGTLGWVLHEPAGPIRSQLIGLAPLAGGTLALYGSARLLMPHLLDPWSSGLAFTNPAESLWAAGALWSAALASAEYGHWTTWAYLYLAFVIGRAIMPSAPDLSQLLGSAVVLIGVAFAVALADVWLSGGLIGHPLAVRSARAALPMVSAFNSLLLFGLVAVALGAAALVPLGLMLRGHGLRPRPIGRRGT